MHISLKEHKRYLAFNRLFLKTSLKALSGQYNQIFMALAFSHINEFQSLDDVVLDHIISERSFLKVNYCLSNLFFSSLSHLRGFFYLPLSAHGLFSQVLQTDYLFKADQKLHIKNDVFFNSFVTFSYGYP